MGSLDVTATMLTYWHRSEENDYHEFRNKTRGENLPYWSPDEFEVRFGPPPWNVINEFMRSVLNEQYHIAPPTRANIGSYEAVLLRNDGRRINPAQLSSGEKVLMWLCLSMYGTGTGRIANPPALLLLDEPDATLHPQMVQKLHEALQMIQHRFGANIIFTTHSPTTIALFDGGSIFQVSENDLVEIETDAAIGELLIGVDQVAIHYTNRRQVYVESHRDEDLYREIFGLLKACKKLSNHISLSFIPAAPKLSSASIFQLLAAHVDLHANDARAISFVQALNGQGNCAQVMGVVESLIEQGNPTVHGIVDWDLENSPGEHLHVLALGQFYAIENAILNPLTLGLYLLLNHAEKINSAELGIPEGTDPLSLCDAHHWQSIADGVTRRVINAAPLAYDVECEFLNGEIVHFDKRYVHMNGHDLEARLKENDVYPFLNAYSKRARLLMEVVQRGIRNLHGRSLPLAVADVLRQIQAAR
jgi:hypothetical protein